MIYKLSSLLIFIFPQAVLAAPLVACNDPLECNYCALVATINNLIEFVITILVLGCVLILMYAGLRLVTSAGDPSAKEEAKKMFTNVIIGFIILLASWTIVDTVLKALLRDTDSIGRIWEPVGTEQCGQMFEPVKLKGTNFSNPTQWETAMDELYTYNEFGDVIGMAGSGTGITASEAQALAKLQAAGVSLKEGARLVGIKEHVIDNVIALNAACNCNVLITEGTGGQHASGPYSHANGYKLDLRTRDNPKLLNYVQSLPSGGSWSDGTKVYVDSSKCAKYAVESDHIDVQYFPSC